MQNVQCKKITREYLEDVIRIHCESLPEDILPSLGTVFLRKYYDYMIDLDGQQLYGILQNDVALGFCQVSRKQIEIIEFLKINPQLLNKIGRLLFFRPITFLSGLLLVERRSRFKMKIPEVSFIAVDKKCQGLGFGTKMIDFVTNAEEYDGGFLTTVTSNPVAKNIYQNKYNAQVVDSFSILNKRYWQLIWCADNRMFY